MQRSLSVIWPFLILLCATSSAAQPLNLCLDDPLPAQCQSYSFEATVTSNSDPGGLFGPMNPGDTITGTLTFDTDVEDIDTSNANGNYPNALVCVRLVLPVQRQMVINLDPEPGPGPTERFVLVENDRLQILGGAFNVLTDNVAATTAGATEIRGGDIPPENYIRAMTAFGYGYSKACIQGFQTPCPPTVVTNDSLPPAPGDITGFDAGQLHMQTESLTDGSIGALLGDLDRIDPTEPVRCPEPGVSLALGMGVLFVGRLARRRDTTQRSAQSAPDCLARPID